MRRRKISKDKISVTKHIEIACSQCGKTADIDVDSDTVKIVCWRCCSHYGPKMESKAEKEVSGFPKGWKFYKIFVHTDGRVFERGEEKPDLKGTLEPTKVEPKQKLSRFEKEKKKQEKEAKMVARYEKKKNKLKKEEQKKEQEKTNKNNFDTFFED